MILELGGGVVDLHSGELCSSFGEVRARLTAQELALVGFLAEKRGGIVTRASLEREMLHVPNDRLTRAIDTAIYRLRKKLAHICAADAVQSVHGDGYRLIGARPLEPQRPPRGTELLWQACDHLASAMALVDCVIYVREDAQLIQAACHGPKRDGERGVRDTLVLHPLQGIVGNVAVTREPRLVEDTRRAPDYVADTVPARSEVTVPVIWKGQLLAIIDSESPHVGAYDREDLAQLVSFARVLACALGAAV